MVNYNTTHNKAAYKYLFKMFYNKTNKKKNKLQIWQHNVRYTTIITIKDVIISKKVREEKILLKDIANTIAPAKVAQVLGFIDFIRKYNWAMSDADLNTTKELGLTGIKKYYRYAGQVKIKLD